MPHCNGRRYSSVYCFLPICIHFLCWLLNTLAVWIFSHFDSFFLNYTMQIMKFGHGDLGSSLNLAVYPRATIHKRTVFLPPMYGQTGRVVGAYVFRNRVGIASLNLWVFISLFICSLVHVFELVSTRPLLVSCSCSF